MIGFGWMLRKPVNVVTQLEVMISKIATVQLLRYTVHQEYFFHRLILLLKIAHAQIRVFKYRLPQLLCKYSEEVVLRCSVKKVFLKILAKFTEKCLWWSLFFNKVVAHRPTSLLEKKLQYMCFSVNFAEFFRTLFYRTPPVAAFEY